MDNWPYCQLWLERQVADPLADMKPCLGIEHELSWSSDFRLLTDFDPLRWQTRLFDDWLSSGEIPARLDIPTGLGKTSVIAIWLIARSRGVKLPRRLVYVVDRRAVVDQATEVAEKLRDALKHGGSAAHMRGGLGLSEGRNLAISTLRGQFADNREWQADPSAPAIIIGTVDMIGSRLLFEGYGVSRGMRPFHAGLLGADTLIALDEAHLVPPFERLIERIETGADTFGPRSADDRALIPPLRLMSLSATSGEREGEVFRLCDDDQDEITRKRLMAPKALRFVAPTDGALETRIAEEAWQLSGEGKKAERVIVFCNSRETAEKVRDSIQKIAKGSGRTGAENIEIETELLVGARRVKEREDAKGRLVELGYIAGGNVPAKPSFLIATAAGEVGVDLDADHLICDLVTYDRMVQRFGRVNRRGERSDTQVSVIEEGMPLSRKPGAATALEKARIDLYNRAQNGKALLSRLPAIGDRHDASPGALMLLKGQAGPEEISAASTPLPLRPELNRALVDAWSMTSLEEHTGRPEVAPWLRGWVDDEPQTTLIWRSHLPLMLGGDPFAAKDIEAFFEAAAFSTNEKLDTETWRVLEWLKKRVAVYLNERTPEANKTQDVFGLVLSQAGDFRNVLRFSDFASADKKGLDRLWGQAERTISGAMLAVSANLAGLRDGMLDVNAEEPATCGDTDEQFSTGFAVRIVSGVVGANEARVSFSRLIEESEDSDAASRWLIVERGESQDGKALARTAQLLLEHQSWAKAAAQGITARLELRADIASAIEIAAHLHDEGKKASNWQRAFKAPTTIGADGTALAYGKTKGPINQAVLGGYRHEFGSLPYAQRDAEFQNISPDLQDLVLHLIAAHHGGARPVIETRGCEDGPPSVLQDRARDVALRFARLQKRFGPWGLAWLETLVRSADQQASRQLEDQSNG